MAVRERRPLSDRSNDSPNEQPIDQVGDKRQRLQSSFIIVVGIVRLLNVLCPKTSFVPDEYWQALEVAHRLAFGYGYLTWEWHAGIRGYSYPLLFAALYKILAVFNLDIPVSLVYLPRLFHLPLAILNDVFVYKLTSRLFGYKVGQYALLVNLLSWFTFYCVTRTLSNSVETCFTPVIVFYWMAACEAKSSCTARSCTRTYLLLVGVSVLVRPTGVLLWSPLVLAHLVLRAQTQGLIILQQTLLIGIPMLIWSVGVDYLCYGKFVIIQWNFFKLNIMDGHAALYGSNSWHWYWTEGLAVALLTHLPIMIGGAWLLRASSWWKGVPFMLGVWLLFFHSLLSHKEHRYIFPVVPLASVYAGYGAWWTFIVNKNKALRVLVAILLLIPVPICAYFSIIHQRGSIAVMDYLRNDLGSNSSVMFLMPCHTTPFYSHIHKPVPMEFLECPPPLGPDWVDISKAFYSAPQEWLFRSYDSNKTLPTHFVLFNNLLPVVKSFMDRHHYEEVHREFHTHFPESERYSSYIVVLRRKSSILGS